jgi:hypothetical protein
MSILLGLAATAGARADVVEVTGFQVNVRERPSRSAAVIVTLPRGEQFELLGRVGRWYHVRMASSGTSGYVHASLVRVIPGAAPVAPQAPATPPASHPVAPPSAPAPAPPPAQEPLAPAPAPRQAEPRPPAAPAPPAAESPQASPIVDSQEREGFWIGLGVGYGSASVSTDEFSGGDREGSATGFLKLGGTLNPQLLVGVESNAWVKSQDDVTLTLGNLAGTVTYYPRPDFGFFVKGGVGLSFVSTEVASGGVDVTVRKTGWGVIAGVGYDWRVGRRISITPCFNFYTGKPGDIRLEGETILSKWKQNVVDFAVGVTFH